MLLFFLFAIFHQIFDISSSFTKDNCIENEVCIQQILQVSGPMCLRRLQELRITKSFFFFLFYRILKFKPRHLFIFKVLCIYVFIFGCAESSLFLFADFSNCSEQRLLSSCGARTSHCSDFSRCGTHFRHQGFSSCDLKAQLLSWHVGSSQTRV